jgi:hypothetical protein
MHREAWKVAARPRRALALAAALLVLAASPAGAGRRVVVAVGANDGGGDLQRLHHAEAEAARVARVFRRLGHTDDAQVLLHVRADAVERALAAVGPEADVLVFYYSGHADDTGLRLGDSRLPWDRLKRLLIHARARVVVAFVDACQSGMLLGKGGSPVRIEAVPPPRRDVEGRAIVTATAADELARESDDLEGSIFTTYLVGGLEGAADRNRDGQVTLFEAYEYAWLATRAATRSTVAGVQTPGADLRLAGPGSLVLTWLPSDVAAGAVLVSPGLGGDLVFQRDGGDSVEALSAVASRPSLLKLAPGAYTIRATGPAGRRAWRAEVRAGQTVSSAEWRPVVEPTGGTKGPVCAGTAAGETCDGRDDDCDGAVDEGCNQCPAGTFVPTGWRCVAPGALDAGKATVRLTRPFLIGATEVTQGEWRRVLGSRPSFHANCGDDCPVESVSWYEALVYLNALSAEAGLPACHALDGCVGEVGAGCPGGRCITSGYRCATARFTGPECPGFRLATEAEWQRAAQAGEADVELPGWSLDNAGGRPHPVAAMPPNAWGLSDVVGNVWEWVEDPLDVDWPRRAFDPVSEHPTGSEWVVRGGGFEDAAARSRTDYRGSFAPTERIRYLGFRAARSLPCPGEIDGPRPFRDWRLRVELRFDDHSAAPGTERAASLALPDGARLDFGTGRCPPLDAACARNVASIVDAAGRRQRVPLETIRLHEPLRVEIERRGGRLAVRLDDAAWAGDVATDAHDAPSCPVIEAPGAVVRASGWRVEHL